MATSKLTLLFVILLFALILAIGVRPDADAAAAEGSDSSSPRAGLDQLKSRIHTLESLVEEKSRELEGKDGLIVEKEKLLQDKLDEVASLQDEISLLQKVKMDAAEQVRKAYAWADESEKQIDKLKKEVDLQLKEKGSLESRAAEAENRMLELKLKLEKLQRINDEQKAKIFKTEQALKVAEVHGAWLALHWIHFKSFAETHWNVHGKPAMNMMMEKKWVPAVKELWVVLSKKSVEVYEKSKAAIPPHIVKVQEILHPYYTEAKKFSKPYIDQVATAAKPHVEKVKVRLEPYTKEMARAYGKFLDSASTYHKQASVLLALPIILLSRICSALFCKQAKKRAQHAHSHHAWRKAKRGHPDNK